MKQNACIRSEPGKMSNEKNLKSGKEEKKKRFDKRFCQFIISMHPIMLHIYTTQNIHCNDAFSIVYSCLTHKYIQIILRF